MNLVHLLGIMTMTIFSLAGKHKSRGMWSLTLARRLSTSAGLSTSSTLSTLSTLTSAASSLLQDPSLIPKRGTSNTFPVYDPANPELLIAEVPTMGKLDAQAAIQQSHDVLPKWRDETTAAHRAFLLQQWSSLIKQNAQDLATIMTLEAGKPLAESLGEVNYAASFLDYYAGEAIRPTGAGGGFLAPSSFATSTGPPRGQIMAIQQAVGVTALITPWNFPSAMITRKVGPALAAGCTAVVKPSELTPLSAMALQTLADRAGIPKHVVQILTTSSETTPDVGTEFCTNPLVKKISFTGSTKVGKLLMKLSSDTVKRLSLELGGNAPFVVFADADLDQSVDAAMASKFRNAGQTCVCADRFLVQAAIYNDFCEKLIERVKALKNNVGSGRDEGVQMGPLISAAAVDNVRRKVLQAIQEGAKCEVGGNPRTDLGTHFYEPTVLTHVSPSSDIWKMETFGPILPIIRFETEQEALSLANDSNVGLSSYFCTNDLSRAFRFSQSLECGIVGVNAGIISTAAAPFGGVKESGLGREGSAMGLAEYLETKYIFMNT